MNTYFEELKRKKEAYYRDEKTQSRLAARINELSNEEREILNTFLGYATLNTILDLGEFDALIAACALADAQKANKIAALKAALAELE